MTRPLPQGTAHRRGRLPSSYKAALTAPTPEAWASIVAGCVEALLVGDGFIAVAFSQLVKIPKGFPYVYKRSRVGRLTIRKVKAIDMLEWLYTNGHTLVTPNTIHYTKRDILKYERALDNDLI